MSRLNVILIVMLVVFLLVAAKPDQASMVTENEVMTQVTPTLSPTPTPIPVAQPSTLIIPRLGIQAPVEEVGVDEIGKMQVPQGASNVGWLSIGYRPGQKGNALIAGHYDQPSGAPAVFYNLSSLDAGDEVKIIDKEGKTHSFYVAYKATYLNDQVPLEQLYKESGVKHLNLITCAGTWDAATHNYSHRLVIYAQSDE